MVNLRCAFRGCGSTSGLFSFPADRPRCLRWLRVLDRPEDTNTSNLRVCSRHFSPHCYQNYTQASMGFSVRLRLTDHAVPNPSEGPPSRLFRETACQTEVERVDVQCQTVPGENHVQCQTSRVGVQNASTQANRKTQRRSTAVQTSGAHRSVSCDTPDPPPRPPLFPPTPGKRATCDGTESSATGASSSTETPHKMRKIVVYEDDQMQLYQQCAVCTWTFVVTTRTAGSLLLVDQSCPHCTTQEPEDPT